MAAPKGNKYGVGNPNSGRPTIYSDELANIIFEKISTTTRSLKTICSDETLPDVGTVLRWLRDNEAFRNQYARAKEEQADLMTEEMVDIADDGSNDTIQTKMGPMEDREWTSRSKLRVDTRKWIASKLKPKKYGDKITQELTGSDGKEFSITLNLNS